MKLVFSASLAPLLLVAGISTATADEVDKQLAIIREVGPGGVGSQAARAACDRLFHLGPDVLPRLLIAMDTSNIVAANWYRTLYEEILRRELAKEEPRLPLQFMRRYVRDSSRQGRVRRLLLELLNKIDLEFGRKLIPTLLDDPEFRGEAVTAALARGDTAKQRGETASAKQAYWTAFRHARDSRLVTQAAARLEAVGESVSIVEHMGFVTDWYLLGPFNAAGLSGFGRVFPPEKNVDLDAVYHGKNGEKITWKRHQTLDRLGQVDLMEAVAPVKEAVGYAYTELTSPHDQMVELRCSADDNCTIWLNGKKIFSRLQWLNGTRFDRFTVPANLKAGKNRLLVKICQGPQHKNPAVPNNWSLQLRFCDAGGAGVGLMSALPAIKATNSE